MDVTGEADSIGSLAEANDLDSVVRHALTGLLCRPGVRRVGLALTEGGGRRLRFTARDRDGQEQAPQWCLIDAYDDVPLTCVVSTGEPIVAGVDDLDRRFRGMVAHQREQGTTALAALPLPGTGSPLGGVILFYEGAPGFGPSEQHDLAVVAAEVAAALVRVRATSQRRERVLADEPVDDQARVGDVVVEGDPRSAGVARRFLRARLGEWAVDEDVIDTAVLLLSELVTNAIIHTDNPAEIRVVLGDGELTVTVRDHGRAGDAGDAEPDGDDDPLRVHGRGLQLVEALSERWGSERDAVGTTVWFALRA
ncbi:hypothetical protein NPS01_18430 [Nocardioides psychrotolerans]|uniref:Anti-sigma regulatory factor (Ser/Thr protein kinase) n=1 Tax=Nocardioides psychrotolerans TaxID=1005945 RepID=A0A1I3JF98_9ACTN|nr:ATP-binding protein [Nocardioides psychrotolerans]GEP38180.1 hypothetical protein NPS01_18430 [Nocardioides psychrotolerans]SFI58648.1 Anti-sigma regulatory factor (Ser/Thr protein kinase) [Nocardioides psychrotolerans]